MNKFTKFLQACEFGTCESSSCCSLTSFDGYWRKSVLYCHLLSAYNRYILSATDPHSIQRRTRIWPPRCQWCLTFFLFFSVFQKHPNFIMVILCLYVLLSGGISFGFSCCFGPENCHLCCSYLPSIKRKFNFSEISVSVNTEMPFYSS